MAYLHYSAQENPEYPVVLLSATIRKDEIKKAYLDPFPWVNPDDLMVLSLHQTPGKKKTPMGEMRKYITEELVPIFENLKTKYVLVADGEYFKALTKLPKTDPYLGYAVDCQYGDFKVIYVPNYKAMFYDPIRVTQGIAQGMTALRDVSAGAYEDPGANIIHFAEYPSTPEDIEQWLIKLLEMDCPLTIDIEGFDLKHNKAGIGSISFAWNKHEGIAFAVDCREIPGAEKAPFLENVRNDVVRAMLKEFFIQLSKKAIYHNIAFDVYVLIYQLFMKDILDTEGLLYGLEVMLKNWDCTKLISYLATNSCAGNKLSLKSQAQEFAGNYAVEEIKDICKIPLPKLLKYNLVDSLSTWFVHEKRYPGMVNDQQEDFYQAIFRPATKDVIQMQLTGMPVNMARVFEVGVILEADRQKAVDRIVSSPLVQRYTHELDEAYANKKNAAWVNKRITAAEANQTFNPNSGPQVQGLLYGMLGLPVISLTDAKQPSCDADTLKALKTHTKNPQVIDLLDAMLDFASVSTILSTFLPALKNSSLGPDGWHYMFGNFNLGGTVSGRLSSSKPKHLGFTWETVCRKLPKRGNSYCMVGLLWAQSPYRNLPRTIPC